MQLNEALNKASGYRLVSLWRNNEKVCAWNTYNKVPAKIEEIETRIKNNGPGVYVIHAKNAMKDNADQFMVEYGDQSLVSEPKRVIPEISGKLLENTKILELSILNAELKKDNESLNRLVEDLENEIEDLNAKIQELSEAQTLSQQEAQPTLMDNAQSFLNTLMEFGAPLLDQHFSLKKQQLEIERMKFQKPQQQAQQQKNEAVQIRVIGEWVETFKDQPEIYEALHEISAKSESVSEYMEYLKQFNSELYEQLSVKI